METAEQLQCPVCTLYLHEGMSLGAHLDTHPKDQVIHALCSLAKGSKAPQAWCTSRCSTPYDCGRSERSYRSRSRTPARRYRHHHSRPPSALEASASSKSDSFPSGPRVLSTPLPPEPAPAELAQEQLYFLPAGSAPRDFSRSQFVFGKQPVEAPSCMYPEERKEPPAPQYPGGAPVHFVLPVTQSFVESVQNNKNMSLPTSLPGMAHNKNVLRPMFTSQFTSLNSPAPSPRTQIVYKEMVQDGKKFVSAIPVSKGQEEHPSQSSVMYQNLMVFNPYAGPTPPPPLYPHPHPHPTDSGDSNRCYTDTSLDTSVLKTSCSKTPNSRISELSDQQNSHSSLLQSQDLQSVSNSMDDLPNEGMVRSDKSRTNEEIIHDSEITLDQGDSNNDNSSKRVKILSNVKVELPIQHIPDIIDLTSSSDMQQKRMCSDITEPNLNTEEALLPDFVDAELCHSYSQNRFRARSNFSLPSNMNCSPADVPAPVHEAPGAIVNTFSVIKNIGNPNVYKDNYQQSEENKPEECIIPDLTCNEKPSISPCSDLTNDSNEEVYERLCALADTAGTSAELPTRLHFPLAARGARKNLFVKKTKKILSIKSSKSNIINLDNPSSSKHFSIEISKNAFTEETSKKSTAPVPEEHRLDGFFKELDKQKSLNLPSVSFEKSTSQRDCESSDDSRSCSLDIKDQSMDMDTECIAQTYNNNDFRNCISDKNNTLKGNNEDCTTGVERLMDNLSQKNFTELETMRPVNVIAFGSMITSNPPSESSTNTFIDVEKSSLDYSSPNKEKHSLDSLIRESYMRDNNVYTEYFSAHKTYSGEVVESNSQQKIEVCIVDEEEEKKVEYINWDTPQKEEYGFSNFLDCSYGQGMYQKIEDPKERKASEQRAQFIPEQEHNEYAELMCPREDNFSEQDHKGAFLEAMGSGEVAALNIRADERMPPRGELSEHESSGDAPWAGMYCDVVGGSTSYDLLARETWPSDGSDMEMPVSPAKNAYNEVEDMPIVVGVKPPDRNYRCATCGKGFNCPKERRVHRSKEHPPTGVSGPPKKIIKKRRNLLKATTIKIKNEKYVKLEPSSTGTKVEESLDDDVNLIPVKIGEEELEEKKPKIELVKEEPKKKRKDYLCATCKLEFTTEPAFNFHLKIHPLECLTCGKYFHKRANLQLHVKRHLGIKNYRCDICEKRFVTKQKLLEHYNVHTRSAPIKCSLCDETFRRHSNMVQHRNRHHFHLKRRLRDYVCHCGEVFHSKKKLAWHKEVHDERPKACLHCSEKFVHVASLTRHMRRAHNSYYIPDVTRQKENVTCPICEHVYLKSSIDMHLRTHTGSKPHSCVICNKNFTTKWNLKLHRWTHANRSSKPFKCSLCKGAFVRHTDYVSHMNSHKSVRPYTCNYCGCQFIRKYNCQRHVKEHENDKKYVCEVPDCGKTFHRSYYLSEHMSVHSGLRPFSCNICGKTSSTKSNHNKHLKIHHAREPVTTEG